ncbi:hypothetical protein AVEN_245900-1 [Araneus ventricosus]|uniref:Uncharacterized protein n=1 Tax=Araneus ventricosus TaxID=182803 RepID=A0A4Y2IH07_ARAVE|nr:hypothetical protein AVEN_245900-1 [Araneus ventricosus]
MISDLQEHLSMSSTCTKLKSLIQIEGCGGLMVRSRLRARKVPGFNHYAGLVQVQSDVEGQTSFRLCGVDLEVPTQVSEIFVICTRFKIRGPFPNSPRVTSTLNANVIILKNMIVLMQELKNCFQLVSFSGYRALKSLERVILETTFMLIKRKI